MSTGDNDNSAAFFGAMSEAAYAEAEERFPVENAEHTYTHPDGRVTNMDREAMMARLEGFRARLVGEIGTGQ